MRAALEVEQEEKKRQENELSLSRKKPEQEAQLEYLRAERQAVEAAAVAKTIAKELGFKYEPHLSLLPTEDPSKWVQEFINN